MLDGVIDEATGGNDDWRVATSALAVASRMDDDKASDNIADVVVAENDVGLNNNSRVLVISTTGAAGM